MIKVSGMATYNVGFEFEIDMTEEEWDRLPERRQNEIIDELIGRDEMESAELDDCSVWDIEELEDAP